MSSIAQNLLRYSLDPENCIFQVVSLRTLENEPPKYQAACFASIGDATTTFWDVPTDKDESNEDYIFTDKSEAEWRCDRVVACFKAVQAAEGYFANYPLGEAVEYFGRFSRTTSGFTFELDTLKMLRSFRNSCGQNAVNLAVMPTIRKHRDRMINEIISTGGEVNLTWATN